MAASYGAAESAEPGLERGAIGLTEVLFQSITHMAPAVATALSIGLATTLAGGITPLAVVFALLACLFTAYSMSQLARHMSSAGGMYTYVTQGLGTFFGWLMAWAFTLAEPIVPAALALCATEATWPGAARRAAASADDVGHDRPRSHPCPGGVRCRTPEHAVPSSHEDPEAACPF